MVVSLIQERGRIGLNDEKTMCSEMSPIHGKPSEVPIPTFLNLSHFFFLALGISVFNELYCIFYFTNDNNIIKQPENLLTN